MVFAASKRREIKRPEPIAEGTQLRPSAAIRDWYDAQLNSLIIAMINDYRREIMRVFKHEDVKQFFAQDASPTSQFKKTMNALNSKWSKVFKGAARKLGAKLTEKVDVHSQSTTMNSLSNLGIKNPKMQYTKNVEETLGAAQEFNHTLVTGIQADAHERIFNNIMLSLTSPNPDEQGQQAIIEALTTTEKMSKGRANLIARDQTSKIYTSLNTEWMKQNGIAKFKWVHSSAGKVPRESHLARDEEIYEHDDPRLWQGPKADQGPPGWAINCRCVAVPVLDIELDLSKD
jgi:SPP1 gp7 family putative phage head morphogenesis protein